VVLVDRANYGRLWPVMKEIDAHPALELKTICAGTMLLGRFGQAEHQVRADGFAVTARVYMEVEGSAPATMAKSVGLGVIEFSNTFSTLGPDVVLIIGDRYESLSAAIAAAYMNIPIAHVQGGEVSGSIDESARHAISKFAHLHFPATVRSAEYLVGMGEASEAVYNYGCPAGDYITRLDSNLSVEALSRIGVGASLKPNEPFLLVIYHPVTTQFGTEREKVLQLISALEELEMKTIWIWPNIDAGSEHISKELRRYRERGDDGWLHLIKNLDPMLFQQTLKAAACCVGNSSSFVRDSTFSGTPVVLVGDRQFGREVSDNVVLVRAERSDIVRAVRKQLTSGRASPSGLYGDGNTSRRIASKLAHYQFSPQKTLDYVSRTGTSRAGKRE
jgi:GDP/UDP-N,N'-diacetylbacillosamine 2-epimerase (hydrolysing)